MSYLKPLCCRIFRVSHRGLVGHNALVALLAVGELQQGLGLCEVGYDLLLRYYWNGCGTTTPSVAWTRQLLALKRGPRRPQRRGSRCWGQRRGGPILDGRRCWICWQKGRGWQVWKNKVSVDYISRVHIQAWIKDLGYWCRWSKIDIKIPISDLSSHTIHALVFCFEILDKHDYLNTNSSRFLYQKQLNSSKTK